MRPHGAKRSRGRVSYYQISPIENGPQPIMITQVRNRGRMATVRPLSAIDRLSIKLSVALDVDAKLIFWAKVFHS